MEREFIFKAINEERAYQDSLPHHSKELDEKTSIGDWLIYMEVHLNRAKSGVYNLNSREALCQIRKVLGLGVACLEHRGLITRTEEQKGTL